MLHALPLCQALAAPSLLARLHSQCPLTALLGQAKPRISGVNTLPRFKGSSGKCYQQRANKAKLSLLKLKALGGREGKVSSLFAWGQVMWGRKRRGRWWVMLCAGLAPFNTWLWLFQAWSMQQVLWPGCSLSVLGREDFAQTLLEGLWLQLSHPWALLVSPFSCCRSNCAALGAEGVLGKGGLNHYGSWVLQASRKSNYSLVGIRFYFSVLKCFSFIWWCASENLALFLKLE